MMNHTQGNVCRSDKNKGLNSQKRMTGVLRDVSLRLINEQRNERHILYNFKWALTTLK